MTDCAPIGRQIKPRRGATHNRVNCGFFPENNRIIIDRNVFARNSAAREPARLTLCGIQRNRSP
jgi:hypothetical protein